MKKLLITASLLALASSHAHAYQTGSLTCQRIGELAAETLAAKQVGVALGSELTKLTDSFEADAERERSLVKNIVTIIYQNDLLVAMKPGDAYLVFSSDCLRGQGRSD